VTSNPATAGFFVADEAAAIDMINAVVLPSGDNDEAMW